METPLTFVQQQDNFVENFCEVHIVVAKFLHLQEKGKLWRSLLTERNEQLRIGLQNKKGEQLHPYFLNQHVPRKSDSQFLPKNINQ